MPYSGGGSYSEELGSEHDAGQHEGYLDPNCRSCQVIEGRLEKNHRAGLHEMENPLCPACGLPEEQFPVL